MFLDAKWVQVLNVGDELHIENEQMASHTCVYIIFFVGNCMYLLWMYTYKHEYMVKVCTKYKTKISFFS